MKGCERVNRFLSPEGIQMVRQPLVLAVTMAVALAVASLGSTPVSPVNAAEERGLSAEPAPFMSSAMSRAARIARAHTGPIPMRSIPAPRTPAGCPAGPPSEHRSTQRPPCARSVTTASPFGGAVVNTRLYGDYVMRRLTSSVPTPIRVVT